MADTYDGVGDESHDIGSNEAFSVHSLVPSAPVLDYDYKRIAKLTFHLSRHLALSLLIL